MTYQCPNCSGTVHVDFTACQHCGHSLKGNYVLERQTPETHQLAPHTAPTSSPVRTIQSQGQQERPRGIPPVILQRPFLRRLRRNSMANLVGSLLRG